MKKYNKTVKQNNTDLYITFHQFQREIFPNSGSEETSIYNNVYGKPKTGQTQDDVYNHLHEQGTRNDADYYDHACAASAYTGDMGDYSHLQHTTSQIGDYFTKVANQSFISQMWDMLY